MATYLEIFLRPLAAQTADAVVAEVSAATAVPLTLVTGYDDVAYAGVRGDTVVELFAGHGYDDDDDMPFGSHPFMVRFRNTDRDVDAARTALGKAYTKLEAMGRYSMFATYDLQYRLELRLGS